MPPDAERRRVLVGESTIPSGLDAPSLARGLVSDWLDSSVHAGLSDDACLLVSELVANSVVHAAQPAGTPVQVRAAAYDGVVRFEVEDQGHGPVRRRVADPIQGGFGLHLVEALAARWGVNRENSNRVWFELAQREPAAPGSYA
jgi:anti-sigma regulatory factor (Ser/Thr protein kinase)